MGCGDLGGREAGRGHLVEQRLEEVVVAAVEDAHPHGRRARAFAAARPPKPAPRITTWGTRFMPGFYAEVKDTPSLTASSRPSVTCEPAPVLSLPCADATTHRSGSR